MSGIVDVDDMNLGKLERFLFEEKDKGTNKKTKEIEIPNNIIEEMSDVYDFALVSRMQTSGTEYATYFKKYGNTNRSLKYSTSTTMKSTNNYVYIVKNNDDLEMTDISVQSTQDIVFGSVSKIFDHSWRGKLYTWVILDVFEDVRYDSGFWSVNEQCLIQKPFLLESVSAPQVVGRENQRLYFVSTDVKLKS